MKANNVIIFVILFLSSVSYCFADDEDIKNKSVPLYMSPYNKEPGIETYAINGLNASQIEKIFSLSDK